jgi:hypothetical protein
MSNGEMVNSVFVQIAAYRDSEVEKTVLDAIAQSSGDNRISFGIHNCYLEEREFISRGLFPPKHSISIINSRAPENLGVQASRKVANSLYSGEDYYLQVDSHSRFAALWDKRLISTYSFYESLGISNPLITQYPAAYSYDDYGNHVFSPSRSIKQDNYWPTRIDFTENREQFKGTRIPTQTAAAVDQFCSYTGSISAGFIFTNGSFAQIEPNPQIAFWGEETLTAARAFTHGFDLVTPFQDIIWHLYVSGQPLERVRRHHAWLDFPDLWRQLDAQSKIEYFRIMTQREVGPSALGSARTLDDYEQFAGLNFRTGEVTQIDLRKLY